MATTDKYDRQIRLWGNEAQARLSTAHVLLLNAGPCGTEALKNLILPGIARYTIVDSGFVSVSDISNNFFVSKEWLAKPRAEAACSLLGELNREVHGRFFVQEPSEFVQSNKVDEYSLVLATEMTLQKMAQIEPRFLERDIPIVFVRSLGFVGTCRVAKRMHCVIETKPSPEPPMDLRICDPFEDLQSYADSIVFHTLDDKTFKHVPFVVILVKLLNEFKKKHKIEDVELSSELRLKFKESIKEVSRKPWGEEENLEEALKNVYMACAPRGIPSDVQDIMKESNRYIGSTSVIDKFNAKFWVLTYALQGFVKASSEGNGKLPVSSRLPDMVSLSEFYAQLCKIYKKKSVEDAQLVFSRAGDILREAYGNDKNIDLDEVATFCTNASNIRVFWPGTLADELQDGAFLDADEIESSLVDDDGIDPSQSPMLWYLVLRAVDLFFLNFQRFPGQNCQLGLADDDSDASKLQSIASTLLHSLGLEKSVNIPAAIFSETVRYGGKELHALAAVMGGIAAQESVKLITHQYAILDNIYVYNGIASVGAEIRAGIPRKNGDASIEASNIIVDNA